MQQGERATGHGDHFTQALGDNGSFWLCLDRRHRMNKTIARRLILGTVLVLLAIGASAAVAPRTIVLVGDSLSAGYGLDNGQGWAALLAARLAHEAPGWALVNASISGDTTSGGLARLPALLARTHPAVVIVELGGNDALRGLSLEATAGNLAAMVRRARTSGACVILVGMRIPPNYGADYADRFAAIFPKVAHTTGAVLVPFLLDGVAQHRDWFQADGIHPRALAQPRMLANVWPRLQPLLEGTWRRTGARR